jgi:prevent-host-death family protein
MKIINIHEAKTQLSKHLQDVSEGKEVIIGKYGQPIARLVPYDGRETKHRLGLLKGKIKISPNFDAPGDTLIDNFESGR